MRRAAACRSSAAAAVRPLRSVHNSTAVTAHRRHHQHVSAGRCFSVLRRSGPATTFGSSTAERRQLQLLLQQQQRRTQRCARTASTTTATATGAADDESRPRRRSFHRRNRRDDDDHLYDKYRRPISVPPTSADEADLLAEFGAETQRTARLRETTRASRVDRYVLQREIEEAASLGVRQGAEETAEIGPAGLYRYYVEDDGNGVRTYRRVSVVDPDENGQVVLQVNYQLEHPGPMSLSVDETYVAYLSVPTMFNGDAPSSSSSKIVVRHIESGEEFVLRGGGQGGGGECPINRAHSVEFGPTYRPTMPDDGSSSSTKRHDLYFTTANDLGRPDSVYRITFDALDANAGGGGGGGGGFAPTATTTASAPQLVHHDTNEANFVDVTRTKGCRFVIVQSTSKVSNEVYLLGSSGSGGGGANNENDAKDGSTTSSSPVSPSPSPVLVRPREAGVQYYVECGPDDGDVFILAHQTTDEGSCEDNIEGSASGLLGGEMSVFRTSLSDLPLAEAVGFGHDAIHLHRQGQERLGEGADRYCVEEMDLFANYIALYERSTVDGRQRIRVIDRRRRRRRSEVGREEDDSIIVVPLPEQFEDCAAFISPGGNIHFESTKLRFVIETPIVPPVMYDYDMELGTLERVSSFSRVDDKDGAAVTGQERAVLPECYCMRVMVPSRDGTAVPLTLVGKKELTRGDDGSHYGHHQRPTVLVGYGSYGQSNSLVFDPTIAPLVNRGFVIAYAHTRGGGELGRAWYRGGRLYDKERAVEDYVACAEALVGELGIALPGQLGARAFSAGGVVAAAAMNASPSLFAAAALTNPFLDVMGAMTDPALRLTEHEQDEWGDPITDKMAAETIERYCPFSNIHRQAYPPTLLIGAVDDENVPCWHPITYAMKRRRVTAFIHDSGDVMLHLEEHGGHHLHGKRLEVASLECSFLLGELSRIPPATNDDDCATKHPKALSLFGSIKKFLF